MTRYFYGAAFEQFPPEELLRQSIAAERAGFDGVSWPTLGRSATGPRRSRWGPG